MSATRRCDDGSALSSEEPPYQCVDVVPRARIGDGLVTLVLAANLARHGARVRVWHEALASLAAWFPALEFHWPLDAAAELESELVVHQREDSRAAFPRAARHLVVGSGASRRGPRLASYLAWSRAHLGLGESAELGLEPPRDVHPRRFPRRIALHPTSREARRNWPAEKFVALAARLAERGFEPHFVVAPGERVEWVREAGSDYPAHALPTLADLARFLCESRLFVGNDSGPGHLASAVGTPTLTLTPRARQARRWRPAWAPSELAAPWIPLPGASLSFSTWRWLLPVRRVEAATRRLLACTPPE